MTKLEETNMSESELSEEAQVGVALLPNKIDGFLQPSFLHYSKQHGINLVPINLTIPLSQQGPFHCILHKLHTQDWNNQLHEFSAKNPNTLIIDPSEFIHRLRNRVTMLESLTQLNLSTEKYFLDTPNQVVANEPKSFNLETIEKQGLNLKFPVIAKPLDVNSTDFSHQLFLVFDSDTVNTLGNDPMVLQEFVNHGGVVFKIYVAGKHVKCVKRKSLSDISEEKVKTTNGLVPFSQISNFSVENDDVVVDKAEMPPQSLIDELANSLRESLGLNLFNVDLIRDAENPTRYLVIDINYFPGYAKLPSYEPFFTNFLLDILQQNKTAKHPKEVDIILE